MNPILRNVLAVVVGIVVGSAANMGLIMMNGVVIDTPEGFDPTSLESIQATAHLLESKHFIFPFLGHAIGTFIGALLAAKLAATRPFILAMIIGVFFLAGGISNTFNIPAPTWFNALDLIVAYLPMAYLGYLVAGRKD